MANGNGSLANAWRDFDDATRLDLIVTELDRVYGRLGDIASQTSQEHSQIRQESTLAIAAIKADFHERIDALRKEVRDGFERIEQKQTRSTGLLYTMIGGIVVGLVLLVVQLAPH